MSTGIALCTDDGRMGEGINVRCIDFWRGVRIVADISIALVVCENYDDVSLFFRQDDGGHSDQAEDQRFQ